MVNWRLTETSRWPLSFIICSLIFVESIFVLDSGVRLKCLDITSFSIQIVLTDTFKILGSSPSLQVVDCYILNRDKKTGTISKGFLVVKSYGGSSSGVSRCPKCLIALQQVNVLRSHTNHVCRLKPTIMCPYCYSAMNTTVETHKHIESIHPGREMAVLEIYKI